MAGPPERTPQEAQIAWTISQILKHLPQGARRQADHATRDAVQTALRDPSLTTWYDPSQDACYGTISDSTRHLARDCLRLLALPPGADIVERCTTLSTQVWDAWVDGHDKGQRLCGPVGEAAVRTHRRHCRLNSKVSVRLH